ncbi:hypothetical protein GLOIN_2v1761875 [Rhizophagus clarus]|uniref:Uncharacterized protein n=1 Tax=Rhizophagus clarus TaxID=94130 RepID=A0A8H3MEP9_9GLOM|nr:hypothetical protein GLOIN_2v1761875 [Rhizophagus clarus]
MSAIITKYVADHKLNKDMSNEELSQHAPALFELLTDKLKRLKGRQRLQEGYSFSKEQVFLLIPDQRIERCVSQVTFQEGGSLSRTGPEAEINICQVSDIIPEGETIREMAQRIIRDNLSERDVKAISRALVETSTDAVVALSRLSRLRRELRILNAPKEIISATLIPEITRASNKIQQERTEQRKNEGLHYPDHFSLESVKERLDAYDVSNTPDKQALADVMIMLCIRPAEIKNLRIANRGAVFASVVHGPKNPSKANTYASEALRHSPDNHTSPSDRYTIVNFRRRGQPYDQAKPFWISDEN